MTNQQTETPKSNIPLSNGFGASAITAGTFASTRVVLAYFSSALELPMFLAGALIAINRTASMVTGFYLT